MSLASLRSRALTAPAGRAVLRRDRLTGAGYAVLATWGWFLYSFGVVVPLLREEQDTSRAVAGLHTTALAAGALVAGWAATRLVGRFRRRGTLRLAGFLVTAGTCTLLLGRPTALTIAAALVTGIGGAILVNTTNPALLAHHGPAGPAAISEGNAVAATVALVAPLGVGAAVALGLTWRPALALVVALVALSLVLLGRVPAPSPALDTPMPIAEGRASRLPLRFWSLAGVIVFCVGVEFCMSTWTADLLRQRVDLGAGGASAAVSAVVAGMAVGRFAVGRLALWLSPRLLLLGAILLAALGWAITWSATTPAPALSGLVVTGLGIAGQYPLAMSLVLATVPGLEDRGSGAVSVSVAFSVGGAPFLLGALADATSVHTAFLIVPALLALALLLLVAGLPRAGSGAGATPADPAS